MLCCRLFQRQRKRPQAKECRKPLEDERGGGGEKKKACSLEPPGRNKACQDPDFSLERPKVNFHPPEL